MALFMSPCPGCGSAIAAAVIVPLLLVIIFIALVIFAYKKGWINVDNVPKMRFVLTIVHNRPNIDTVTSSDLNIVIV